MAAPISQVGLNELFPMLKALEKGGADADFVTWARRAPNARALMKWYEEQTVDLIHGVFNKQVDVLAAFKARCVDKRIDLGKFSWDGPEQAPEFDPSDPETVVVLDATLDTLQNTFEFAWEWTVDWQVDSWRDEGMFSDAKHLRLLSDDRNDNARGNGPEFKPYTLRWVRIKLDTNVGSKPSDVRDPKSSPGCALLFMSAEHPERIKATDYKMRFGFWLPGLKCTTGYGDAWENVPYVHFHRNDRDVGLYTLWNEDSHGDLAVPSFRE